MPSRQRRTQPNQECSKIHLVRMAKCGLLPSHPLRAAKKVATFFLRILGKEALLGHSALTISLTFFIEMLFCELLLAFNIFQTRSKKHISCEELLQCSTGDHDPEQGNRDGEYLKVCFSLNLLRNIQPILDEIEYHVPYQAHQKRPMVVLSQLYSSRA